MSKFNLIGLTWISCLSYALTGALVIITGIVMDDIARSFHLSPAEMSTTFTFLNSGILVAIMLNAWLMEIIPLKRQLIFGFVLMVLAIAGLVTSQTLAPFSASMFTIGIVSGITMSIGTFLITHLYEGRQRGARLLFTDSFFSMAGMVFPKLAAFLLTRSLPWYWIYICIGIIYLAIFVLTLNVDFPVLSNKAAHHSAGLQQKENWGTGVLFLAIAALCYILGQLSFIAWVPEHVRKDLNMDVIQVGDLIGSFWTAYMIGMWAFSAILRFFDPLRIVTVLTLLATLLMYSFVRNSDPAWLKLIIMALGFFSSAIYTTIITLGSLQTKVPSPKLINFILTCGTIGTMLTFVVSGPIVKKAGVHAALMTATASYATVFIMCLLLGFVTKHRSHNYYAHQ